MFSFPSCVHVLVYLQLQQNNDFGFNQCNLSPKRHLYKNIFSPILALCFSNQFQQKCVSVSFQLGH